MIPVILMIVGGLIVLILLVAAMKPNTFKVERSGTINAPPEKIFPLLNDFHEWARWSPWEKRDPNLQRNYGGSPSGVGATYHWVGNKQVGEGRMEITESVPSRRIVLKLDFISPFEAHNITEFTLTPGAGGTTVHWLMHGPASFMTKLMTVFMSMDKMVGKDFEQGLANMKAVAE